MSDPRPMNVYLAGDSTVQTYKAESAPQAGWGQYIAGCFTEDVQFFNHAIGGRSTKTFVEERRLEAILNVIGTGDYLFVQMGHNDSTVSKPERYTEPFGAYKQYLKMYIDGARSRSATPLLITPVGRLNYREGVFVQDFKDYCDAMKQVAAEENVLIIDLMARSLKEFTSIGYDNAVKLFMISHNGTDCTHFTQAGAELIARLVAEGIQDLKIDLSEYVRS